MERRRDERISVSLKAALLNEKTLPKGCRVRDFSQRGMLLQYEYDGSTAIFNDGDSVTVRLSLRQDDERKVVTLPSTVRRVDQNGIGVEFHQPESRLLELLESFRLDKPRAQQAVLEEDRANAVNGGGAGSVAWLARSRARHRLLGSRLAGPARGGADHADGAATYAGGRTPAASPVPEPAAAALTDRRLFYVGLVSLLCAALILFIDFADNAGLKNRLSALEVGGRNQANALSEMREQFSAVSVPPPALAELSTRVDTLTVSVAALEGRLAAAAPDQPIAAAGGVKTPHTQSDPAAGQTPVSEPVPEAVTARAVGEVEAALDRPAAGSNAPWLINLVSLYDKAAADRFMAAAESKGVRVQQNRVMVKGRQVWRLQISGFATEQEARAYGATARDKLGLKDVWVFKR